MPSDEICGRRVSVVDTCLLQSGSTWIGDMVVLRAVTAVRVTVRVMVMVMVRVMARAMVRAREGNFTAELNTTVCAHLSDSCR